MPSKFILGLQHYRLPPAGPGRTVVLFIFVNTFGLGMYMTAGLLYLTRSVGLPTARVGITLTVAGLIALPVSLPIGRLSDRVGPRGLTVVLLLVEGLAMSALALVRSIAVLAVVATVAAIALQGGRTLRSVLIARAGGTERVRLRAYSRATANLAMALGAVAAGVAVQLDSRRAYVAVILINAVTFFAAAMIVRGLPRYPPLPAPSAQGRSTVLRDRPYLAITVLNLLMTLQYGVLTVAIPLWIVEKTQAPRATVAAALLLNTVLVVLLQMRVGRRVENVAAGARMMRWAGLVFLLSCSGLALTGRLSPVWAAIAVLGLVGLHTVGELWHAAATFEMSYQLAPEHAQGEYQGMFALGVGASQALAPGLLTLLCLTWAPSGWVLLGGLLAVTGLLVAPVARWAERRISAEDEPIQLSPAPG